jgi:eukaryotic-like serine/threonine-protein kinase
MAKRVGRFEIIRELGRGAQSVVYLARDPHLQREVAIKTLHFSEHEPQKNQQLLAEARMVSQLRHPNIVPIFEAGEEEHDLYLVFEYVPGQNLAEHLKVSGALTPVKAIAIMHPILDAIAHAHAAGIIHRDLKPTNILIDDTGTPRVMDFGIAARVEGQAKNNQEFSGTPAYMAPEYITKRESSERSDVFSAGLVFYELLTGQRAVPRGDISSVMAHIASEDIRIPTDGSITLDDRIVSVLYKALERDPQQRYATATQMREAFDSYLEPEQIATSPDAKQSTIDFLLRRMRHKSDFPALSESVSSINKLTASESKSIGELSNSILKDFSLTNKILRLVNSAFYRQAGGGNISTVSRAVVVLGFDAVRNIAITVMLFDHMQNKGNANFLKGEFLRANLAGILAKEVGAKTAMRDVEQAFVCSMFHNLWRLLCQYYFPDESEEIKRVMQQKRCTEESAALRVLGISFEDLGIGIARTWGFPKLLINSMRTLPAGSVRKPLTPEDRLCVLAAFSNELCKVIADAAPDDRQKELRKVTARFGESIALSEKDMRATIEKSFEEVRQFSKIINLNMQQTAFGRQIKAWSGEHAEAPAVADGRQAATDTLSDTMLSNAVPEGAAGVATDSAVEEVTPDAAEAILMAGIQDISNTLVSDFKLNDVLRIILETMYRAKGFHRVILCIRDSRSNSMVGRFGFGQDSTEVAKCFNIPLAFAPDIFHVALSKGVDVMISDTHDEKIAARIPEWFRKGVAAGSFVIFPLCIKGSPMAMIYADRERAGQIVIPEKELSLLRTLRNQALLAIKQST